MASAHRTINDLPTLRCSIGFRERRPVLLTQGFVGADVVTAQIVTPLDLPNGPDVRPYHRAEARRAFMKTIVETDDQPIAGQIAVLDQHAPPGVPLWLQVGQDSAEAALLGWERAILAMTGRGTLRIPNFLKNPFVPSPVQKIAICASEPRAKGEWDLPSEIVKLLRALKAALSHRVSNCEITLFLPEDGPEGWHQETGIPPIYPWGEWADLHEDGSFEIRFAEPTYWGLEPIPQTRTISPAAEVTNPWLVWMQNHYRFEESGVDAVHFLCPGYFSGGQGALALAESPQWNFDEHWARFVGQNELLSFYDSVGASIMGFTALGGSSWAEGIYRLAYDLSWARPGAIYAIDPVFNYESLPVLLRGIYTEFGLEPDPPTTTPAYAYPAMLQGPTGMFELVSDQENRFVAPHPEVEDVLSFVTSRSTSDLIDTQDSREVFLGRVSRSFDDSGEARAQQAQVQRYVAAEQARVSSVKVRSPLEKAKDSGTQLALDFIEEIMKR